MSFVEHTSNPAWKDFLLQLGAQFDASGKISTFGQPEIERFLIKHGPVITSLCHQALLKVSGNDAFTFLQGQLSNDLGEVTDNQAQYSAYCDPQGQVLAIFLIFKFRGDFYLSFDGSLKESIQKRLKMFVLRSAVQIEDVSHDFIHIGFAGEFADLDVQRRLSTKIKEIYACGPAQAEQLQDSFIVKVPGPYHRYEIFGPAEQMQYAWTRLRENSDLTNSYDWDLLNIAAGIADIEQATSGKTVAQFLNLDKIGAINFKKGCFPGQEIIARIHYRGKVTKRLLRLHLDSVEAFNAGDTLTLTDDSGKNHNLDIIKARPDIFKGTLCLAVGTLKSLENAEGQLKLSNGATAIIEPLPYSILDDE
ncbi:MAG: folate-binding protein YgfZ [Thiotrichales bacterium]|nr:folate-binding protein YgfZ [Thiotrichales bacterium]